MVDLSQHKTLFPLKSRTRIAKWYGVPVRIFALTVIGALLSFAVSLLFGILGTVTLSALRGGRPDMRIAYREIAFPIAMIVAVVILISATIMEVRNYRQGKTLQNIERIS